MASGGKSKINLLALGFSGDFSFAEPTAALVVSIDKMETNHLSNWPNELLFEVTKDLSSSKFYSVDFSSACLPMAESD